MGGGHLRPCRRQRRLRPQLQRDYAVYVRLRSGRRLGRSGRRARIRTELRHRGGGGRRRAAQERKERGRQSRAPSGRKLERQRVRLGGMRFRLHRAGHRLRHRVEKQSDHLPRRTEGSRLQRQRAAGVRLRKSGIRESQGRQLRHRGVYRRTLQRILRRRGSARGFPERGQNKSGKGIFGHRDRSAGQTDGRGQRLFA